MKTKDYEKFKILPTNREVRNGLVKRLKASIEKIGYIDARPILVNSKMEILDGQNRFVACKELGIPITYSIHESQHSNDTIISELNKNQEVWRLGDYIEHFAKKGVKFHIGVSEFEKKHWLGISNAISICSGVTSSISSNIRDGKNRPLNNKREEIAAFIKDCRSLPFYKNGRFVQAVVVLFNKVEKSHIEKLRRKHLTLKEQANCGDYLNMFQNVINKNKSNQQKISLC